MGWKEQRDEEYSWETVTSHLEQASVVYAQGLETFYSLGLLKLLNNTILSFYSEL